ncbi:SWIM zinc finger domain protein [Natrialba magadii ATCC 43099]|uniref:SWIM zinc finger domain protein n=1 Tax=Natrialba magadii (strain ATCC 43099 / DSM 3394 / CCM 3739 / CIP 104546 / IAM 13178 / JCM 8861 / NBRC 102185 / NCIMB 2190 / MS3) TaxID=547559 RepID=D3SWC4_NATMM|nr:SWIM zinc finger family protein [Natrialba magadii]ADD03716.1 SWIM zinc finger domain protein [Natrialba magadii ATCC 43099]ELY33771.1 zinc finger SWIM domain-containing protein [Natrialba magadii ATCC 43099]
MKLRYYAEADVEVDHRRTLELLESIHEEHAIPVEVIQVDPQRAPPTDFVGHAETRSLANAWDDFTYNKLLQEGLGGAPSKRYRDREDIVGNVGIVVDGDLVWATEFWGTHHGWGAVDPADTAIGFLEEVHRRGTAAVADRVPLADWSWSPPSPDTDSESESESDFESVSVSASETHATTSTDSPVEELRKPTRDAIRERCTAQSFQRGVSYFEEGRLRALRLEGRTVTATVQGSREYRTTVDLSAADFDSWCSCPYDYAGDCKHIVAVLLAVRDRYDELLDTAHPDLSSDESSSTSSSGGLEPSAADDDLESALETTDAGTLREFLRDVLAANNSLRERFLATAGHPVEKHVADYKRDLNRQFETATGRHGIVEYDTRLEFDEYEELAATYRESGAHERALDIYRALSEAIHKNLERIDDSSGHYGRQLEATIDAYAACVREAGFDREMACEHIEYLYEQFLRAEFRFVRNAYDDALREVCSTADELEYLLSLVQSDLPALEGIGTDETMSQTGTESSAAAEPSQGGDEAVETDAGLPDPTQWRLDVELFTGGELDIDHLSVGPLDVTDFIGDQLTTILEETESRPDGNAAANARDRTVRQSTLSMDAQQRLSMYLWVLSELEDREQRQAVLEEVYTERSEFYCQYVDVLRADGQDQRAQAVLEAGLEEFPHSVAVYQQAAEFYHGRDDERYRDVLRTLFVRFEDWDAYDDLRSVCSAEEWESISHGLRTQLGRLDPDRLLELYVREDALEKGLKKILESDDLETFREYREPVAAVDPEAYFEAYRESLDAQLAADTGRDHYRTIIEHLEELDRLECDEEVAVFVEHLREKHSNRPAFLDELERAGYR